MLDVRDLQVFYGVTEVLKGVSCDPLAARERRLSGKAPGVSLVPQGS
jgi:hypothetical protein